MSIPDQSTGVYTSHCVVVIGRMWINFRGWYKVCFHRGNPAIIDKYQNCVVQRVKETCN